MSYGGGPKCAHCNKTVYMNEQVFAAGRKFHKVCFKCTQCNKPLETMTMAEHDGNLFCKTCHKRKFANFDMVKPTDIGTGSGSGPNACGRCGKTVYHAEKAVGAGKVWHKLCFRCEGEGCNKGLDSSTVADKDGHIFCKGCYAKQFGPKGFGYGQGAGALHLTS